MTARPREAPQHPCEGLLLPRACKSARGSSSFSSRSRVDDGCHIPWPIPQCCCCAGSQSPDTSAMGTQGIPAVPTSLQRSCPRCLLAEATPSNFSLSCRSLMTRSVPPPVHTAQLLRAGSLGAVQDGDQPSSQHSWLLGKATGKEN